MSYVSNTKITPSASKSLVVFTLENTCVNLKIFQVKYIFETSSKCFWPNASHTSNVFVSLPDNYNLKFISHTVN